MAFDSIFPFLPNTAGSPPQLFPYDVVINTAFPGVEFIGTEPNAEYQEIREVNGNFWLVTNAQWNANLLQWDQEVNQNTTLPAFALELAANGDMTRYESPATLIPDTPITWVPMFQVNSIGEVISTPLEVTNPEGAAQQIHVTWNAGLAVQLFARAIDVTDISSAPTSDLDNLSVNGVPKWVVDKNGVLQVGIIPASAIFPPPVPFPGFNNVTLTGTTIFTGPAVFNSTVTENGPVTDNSTLHVVGHTTLDGGLTVTDGESVTGGLTTDTLHVTGISNLDGTVTAGAGLSVAGTSTLHNVVLAPGDTITVNGTTPVVTLESTDGSIGIIQVSPVEYNLSVLTAPIAPGSAFVNTAFFPLGSTFGSISLGPLPGTGADTYRVICWGALQFQNASKELTLTGVVAAGVTWDIASQQYENSNSGTFPYMYFGTATGGTTPTINWTCNDTVAFTPMFMTIMASIQL